jgi:hypothetical protein
MSLFDQVPSEEDSEVIKTTPEVALSQPTQPFLGASEPVKPKKTTRGRREDAGEVLEGARKMEVVAAAFSDAVLQTAKANKPDEQATWRDAMQTLILTTFGEERWQALEQLHQNIVVNSDYMPIRDVELPNITLVDILGMKKQDYIELGKAQLTDDRAKLVFELLAKELPWGVRELYSYKEIVGSDGVTKYGYVAEEPDLFMTAMIAMPFTMLYQCHNMDVSLERGEDVTVCRGSAYRFSQYGIELLIPANTSKPLIALPAFLKKVQDDEFRALSLMDKTLLAMEGLQPQPVLNIAGALRIPYELTTAQRKGRITTSQKKVRVLGGALEKWRPDLESLPVGGRTETLLPMSELLGYLGYEWESNKLVKLEKEPVAATAKVTNAIVNEPAKIMRSYIADMIDPICVEREHKPYVHHVDHGNRYQDGERTNLDAHPVSEQELLERYGLRGIQYGNYVTQAEREGALRLLYFGLGDLATALGVEPGAIGIPIDGKALGIAIGARGRGNAGAHYERAMHVINLTKGSGGGLLGHEYAHALDEFMGRTGTLEPRKASDVQGTVVASWVSRLKDMSWPSDWTRQERLDEIERVIQSRTSLENLVLCGSVHYPYKGYREDIKLIGADGLEVAVITGSGRSGGHQTSQLSDLIIPLRRAKEVNPDKRVFTANDLEKTLEIFRDAVKASDRYQCRLLGETMQHLKGLEESVSILQETVDEASSKLADMNKPWLSLDSIGNALCYEYQDKCYSQAANVMRNALNMEPVPMQTLYEKAPRFLRAALVYDHGVKAPSNESKGYYTKPTEMFARAFGGVLYEALAQEGIHNELLTASSEVERWGCGEDVLMFAGLTEHERKVEYEAFVKPELIPAIREAMMSVYQKQSRMTVEV